MQMDKRGVCHSRDIIEKLLLLQNKIVDVSIGTKIEHKYVAIMQRLS